MKRKDKHLVITFDKLKKETIDFINILYKDINQNDRRCFDFDEDGSSTIVILYEIIDGVLQQFDENTHHGSCILTDTETEFLVREMMSQGFIDGTEPYSFLEVNEDSVILS
jgi:hypothetical protein